MARKRTQAPTFTAQASDGRVVHSDAYRGRHLVLFFFPAAFSYGSTCQMVRFRDRRAELHALGADVVGVGPDPIEVQRRFAEHYQAAFPILADVDLRVAAAFGALFPVISRVKRATYILDAQGRIAALVHRELQFEKHADAAVAFLKSRRAHAYVNPNANLSPA